MRLATSPAAVRKQPTTFLRDAFPAKLRKTGAYLHLYSRTIPLRTGAGEREIQLSGATNCRHHPTGTGSSCLTMIHGFKTIVKSVTSFTLLTLTRHLSATTTQLSRGSYEQQGRNRDDLRGTRRWPPICKALSNGDVFSIPFNFVSR